MPRLEDEKILDIINMHEDGYPAKVIASHVRCHQNTVFRWIKRHKEGTTPILCVDDEEKDSIMSRIVRWIFG